MCRDNDNGISDLNGILTAGNADFTVSVDTANEHIFFEGKLCQRDAGYGRFFTYQKFQCFRAAVQYLVQGFYIAADGIGHGPYITQNVVCGQVFGINYAADVQIVDNIVQISAATQEVTACTEEALAITEDNFVNAVNAHEILEGVMEISHRMDKYINSEN